MSGKLFFVGLFSVSASAALLACFWPHDAEYYFNRGEERLMPADEDGDAADFAGARADFNRAIKLNPKFTAAYRARAGLEEGNDALADFSRAIELEPTNELNYISRAYFWDSHNNRNKALADLNQAIEVNSNDEGLFTRRAQLKHKMGDFSGMMADMARASEVFTPGPADKLRLKWMSPYAANSTQLLRRLLWMYDKAVKQNPNFYWGYYHRGALKHLANDLDGALEDFRRCAEFSDVHLKDHAAIHIWLVRTQRGETNAATDELLNHFNDRMNQPSPDWEVQIARFLANQINEEEFFAVVGKNNAEWEQSEVWYYSAMKHLLAGDKINAVECFEKSKMTRTRPYVVAISSQIEMTRLNN